MLVRQGSDQAQELLLRWTLSTAQELGDPDMLDLPAGGDVGLVPDEHLAGRIPDQVPVVAVGAVVELAGFLHAGDPRLNLPRAAFVMLSGPRSGSPVMLSNSASLIRARLTRLLIVPTATPQISATSS
jgi:hypothetical protein